MRRYLDPKNDLVFKRIFGEHKHLCISLLNNMLPFDADSQIVDIEYQTTELAPDRKEFRHSVVDVRCTDNFGRQFLVEMQIQWTKSFHSRVLFNASKAYSRQLDINEDYEYLQPVYALSFLNANMDDSADYYHHYKILDIDDNTKQIKGMEFVFIELKKFQPTNRGDKKLHELWLRFLTEVGEKTKQISDDLLVEATIKEAISYAEVMGYSEEQLAMYDKYIDSIRCEKSLLSAARKEGFAKGTVDTQRSIAMNLLKSGIAIEIVSQSTGLSIDEIHNL